MRIRETVEEIDQYQGNIVYKFERYYEFPEFLEHAMKGYMVRIIDESITSLVGGKEVYYVVVTDSDLESKDEDIVIVDGDTSIHDIQVLRDIRAYYRKFYYTRFKKTGEYKYIHLVYKNMFLRGALSAFVAAKIIQYPSILNTNDSNILEIASEIVPTKVGKLLSDWIAISILHQNSKCFDCFDWPPDPEEYDDPFDADLILEINKKIREGDLIEALLKMQECELNIWDFFNGDCYCGDPTKDVIADIFTEEFKELIAKEYGEEVYNKLIELVKWVKSDARWYTPEDISWCSLMEDEPFRNAAAYVLSDTIEGFSFWWDYDFIYKYFDTLCEKEYTSFIPIEDIIAMSKITPGDIWPTGEFILAGEPWKVENIIAEDVARIMPTSKERIEEILEFVRNTLTEK